MKSVIGVVIAFLTVTGSLPAAAAVVQYDAVLSGAAESPPNGSAGTGFAIVTIDTTAMTLEVKVNFSGLQAGDTASHIHCCAADAGTGTAGVATVTPTFTDFPSGVTAGTYDHIFDLMSASTYNPAFVTANGGTTAGAESALLAGLRQDEAYLNIHTTVAPGGEIRGFLTPVPLPAGLGLVASALTIGMPLLRRKARRT